MLNVTNISDLTTDKGLLEKISKVHDELYENLLLLTKVYPAGNKMEGMLKKDMFKKNNKAASHEVLYYLLKVADPQLVQDTITTWPPYDIKRETKFRREVLQCFEEVRSRHHADLPNIMASHLISPGGYKFAHFIYKLSQLVMFQHLKKTEAENILRIPKKYSKFTPLMYKNIKSLTDSAEREVTDCLEEHEKYYADSLALSRKILDNRKKSKKLIFELTGRFKDVKVEFDKKYPSYPSVTHLMESLQSLKSNWDCMKKIHWLFQECNTSISYLTSKDQVLEHNKDFLKGCLNQQELDLSEYFKYLSVYCEKSAFELPNPTKTFLKEIDVKLDVFFEKYAQLEEGLTLNRQEFKIAIDEVYKLMMELLAADD